MPKSKRFQKVSLTNTKKKGLESKQTLVKEIRRCVDEYARIFVLSFHHMRNSKLKDVRQEWKQSRFFFGKNKVEQLALGKDESDEYRSNLHLISQHLLGQCALLFTNRTKVEVMDWFSSFSVRDYARSGNTATDTITVRQGPLKQFAFNMEPQLRQLGLPTTLTKGVVTLLSDFTICQVGDVLTPEQTRILKLFEHKLATFHISVTCMWSGDGGFEEFPQRVHSPPPHARPERGDTDSDSDME